MKYQKLENGCEIYRHDGLEIGIMQTEIPGKPEAWLFWMEGQGLTSERQWNYGTRQSAIDHIALWLQLDDEFLSFIQQGK